MISHMCAAVPMFAGWYRSKMRLKMDVAERSTIPTLCSYRIVSILVFILADFGVVAAQQPSWKQSSSPDTGFVLRRTVRRVRVDVIVTDAQGRPVKGLNASDFRSPKMASRNRFANLNGAARISRQLRFPSVRRCPRVHS